MIPYAVVIPTVGRPCLSGCLAALTMSKGPEPARIIVIDDRPPAATDEALGGLPLHALGPLADRASVLRSGGRGPAAARNTGLRTVDQPWTVLLDDDVRVGPTWREELARDLAGASPDTGGVQGIVRVPLPSSTSRGAHRRPTDWERTTAGLENALWATADMAYRTEVLKSVGGFDERFPRAFREDADLALRVLAAGWLIRRGRRRTDHPVRPADRWVSLRAQRGNADDALMVRLHGSGWWERAAAPRGRIRRHMAVTAAGASALALAATGRHRAAAYAAAGWLLGTAEFACARIAPGPRTRDEILTMTVTSALIPALATWHRLTGAVRHRSAGCWNGGAAA